MEFKDKLKILRLKKDLSQGKLSKLINVSPSLISGYEQGLKLPTYETLFKLCEILDTTPNNLLCWDNSDLFVNINISRAIEKANISMEVLSERTNIDLNILKAYDEQKQEISYKDLRQISGATRCTIDYLLNWSSDTKSLNLVTTTFPEIINKDFFIGSKIKELREIKNIDITKFSKLTGIKLSLLSDYENNLIDILNNDFFIMVRTLKLNINKLIELHNIINKIQLPYEFKKNKILKIFEPEKLKLISSLIEKLENKIKNNFTSNDYLEKLMFNIYSNYLNRLKNNGHIEDYKIIELAQEMELIPHFNFTFKFSDDENIFNKQIELINITEKLKLDDVTELVELAKIKAKKKG